MEECALDMDMDVAQSTSVTFDLSGTSHSLSIKREDIGVDCEDLVGSDGHQLIDGVLEVGNDELGGGAMIAMTTETGEQILVRADSDLAGELSLEGFTMPSGMMPVTIAGDSELSGQVLTTSLASINGQKVLILTPSSAMSSLEEQDERCEMPCPSPPLQSPATSEPASKRLKLMHNTPTSHAVTMEIPAQVVQTEEEDQEGEGQTIFFTLSETGPAVEGMTEEVVDVEAGEGNTTAIIMKPQTKATAVKNMPRGQAGEGAAVSQAWFTTRDDKVALQVKGHQWKQGQWAKDEVELLHANIEKYCKYHNINDPTEIIFEMSKDERKDFYRTIARGLQRPLFSVYRRVIRMYDQKNHIGKYSPEELEKLKSLREKHGTDWASIGAALGRSASSVKDRCRLMKDTCNSGKWHQDEEARLAEAVFRLTGASPGDSITSGLSWAMVAEHVATRSEKQCRTKWLNFLNWKQCGGTDWTRTDDLLLISRLQAAGVDDETQVDWTTLANNWPSVRSPQWLRGKWWSLKRHISEYHHCAFSVLLQELRNIHMPKVPLKMPSKSSLPQVNILSHSLLQAAATSIANSECSSVGMDSTVVTMTAEEAEGGLEVLQGYTPVMGHTSGTFLITQPQSSPSISFSSADLNSDHIIVHHLPVQQDGVVQLGQQYVISGSDGVVTALEDEGETIDTLHLENNALADLKAEDMEDDQIIHSEDSYQTQVMSEGDLTTSNHPEADLDDGSGSLSGVGDLVGAVPVRASPQFSQTAGADGDLIMSSMSDPMLPSDSVDLIGSASDMDGEKSQSGADRTQHSPH